MFNFFGKTKYLEMQKYIENLQTRLENAIAQPKPVANELSKQEAIDGILVLEKLYLTMAQMGAKEDTLKSIERKINKLLDLI